MNIEINSEDMIILSLYNENNINEDMFDTFVSSYIS